MTDALCAVLTMSELLDSLSIAVCLFDDEHRMRHWNRTFLVLFPEHAGHVHVGEPYRDNLRRFYESRLDETELPHMERYIADGITRHATQSLPYVFRHRDQWVRVAALPVGELGRLRLWIPIAPPTGDAQTLHSLSSGLGGTAGSALDGVADGMIVAGPDGRICEVNDRFLMLYRLADKAEAVGKTCAELMMALPGSDAGRHAARLAFADNQRFAGAPFEVRVPDDRWMRVIEQRAGDGHVVSTHYDITEMKRLEIATSLARSEAEAANRSLTLAAQIAHIGHWRLELPSRHMTWSDEVYQIFGQQRGQFVPTLGRTACVLHDEDRGIIDQALAKTIVDRCEAEASYRIIRPDGGIRHVRSRGIPQIGPDGELEAVFGVIVDETEQMLAREKLLQSEKMQIVGGIAAGVAHDFNNILQVVTGNLERILAALPAEMPASIQASDALHEARRAAELTHNLLAYARRQVLTPARLELPGLMLDMSGLLSRTLGARIAVTLVMPRSLSAVLADRAQLQTAVMNLALNAAHAMPDGGQLELDVDERDAAGDGSLPPGRYVVLTVRDNGLGMEPDVLARAFEPFFTTRGAEGVGLGLAMVKGFSQQSGGDTRIMSSPGAGTRVEIWLPALHQTEATMPTHAQPPPQPIPSSSRGRVLVVDDEPAILALASDILRQAGYAVDEATDGEQALARIVAGERFDAIVTDHLMPGLTGVELIARARESRPGQPSLIMTGFADIAGYDPNGHDSVVLIKPFRIAALVSAVNQLIGTATGDAAAE